MTCSIHCYEIMFGGKRTWQGSRVCNTQIVTLPLENKQRKKMLNIDMTIKLFLPSVRERKGGGVFLVGHRGQALCGVTLLWGVFIAP